MERALGTDVMREERGLCGSSNGGDTRRSRSESMMATSDRNIVCETGDETGFRNTSKLREVEK